MNTVETIKSRELEGLAYPDRLEAIRDQVDISSVDRSIRALWDWADYRDTAASPEGNGRSNREVLERLLTNTESTDRAFFTGYNGNNQYPIEMDRRRYRHLEHIYDIFESKIFAHKSGAKGELRTENILRQIDGKELFESAALSADTHYHETREFSPLQKFVLEVTAAHKVYQYMYDTTVRGLQKEKQFSGEFRTISDEKIKENFWSKKLLGAKSAPGVIQAHGTLARLHKNINDFALEEYGDKAEDFISAWWAVANLVKPSKEKSFAQTTQPIVDALMSKDLGSASMSLKECLYENEEMLPYGSRRRFALSSEESDFFEEISDEERRLKEQNTRSGKKPKEKLTPIEELPVEEQVARLKEAASYIGFLMNAEICGRDKTFFVIDVKPESARRYSGDKDATETKLQWNAVLGHCEVDEEAGTVYRRIRTRFPVDRFIEVVNSDPSLIDAREEFLDEKQRTFQIDANQ